MAFGITREELKEWQRSMEAGNIALLTHYWLDERFPGCRTVTKAGCTDVNKLAAWGRQYGLKKEWIDLRNPARPHFDLFGDIQYRVLKREGCVEQIHRFKLKPLAQRSHM